MIFKGVSRGLYLSPTSEIVIGILLGSLKCMSTKSDAITKKQAHICEDKCRDINPTEIGWQLTSLAPAVSYSLRMMLSGW